MVIAASLALIAVATLMFFGWGAAFLKLLRLEPANWPLTVALGMAAVVFLGGILNLTRLAYPVALAIVAVIGIVLAFRARISLERPPLIIGLLIAIIVIFTIATRLPPSIYNFHDDYQKYFAYPVRMVETGTVFGSPLSAMGLQTLGAQAFLDGFVVAFFPIVYINGVDAVFGLFLCLILATQFTTDRFMRVVCVASVVLINPQYVNISTLYCGSAMIMAMAAVEDSAALGLLYAALIAMKPIYAVFVAIHLLTIAAGGIRSAVRTGLAAAIFLSPWVLVHAPNYLAALRILDGEAQQQQEAVSSSEDSLQLFSNRYKGGVDTYLQVINAQTVALMNERNNVDILRRRMDASVLLIKALGGGWTISELPKEATLR